MVSLGKKQKINTPRSEIATGVDGIVKTDDTVIVVCDNYDEIDNDEFAFLEKLILRLSSVLQLGGERQELNDEWIFKIHLAHVFYDKTKSYWEGQ